MIGVVGPKDSVALAQQAAREMGRAADLAGVAYEQVDEAIGLARSLEPTCDVVLFTGQVPFERAKRVGPWRCDLDVILHSQADLYRMIGMILMQTGGQFPLVSVDSLDAATVRDVFSDMGLPIPEVIIPVVDESGSFVFEDVEGTARAHLGALARGEVGAALTCLAGTHHLLRDAGVPTWRIDHARVTIVGALQRAWLASEVKRTRGESIAVALVLTTVASDVPPARAAALSATLNSAIASHARRMSSRVARDGDRNMLTTTQAAVQEMLARHRNGQKSLVDLATKPPAGTATHLGIGFGGTFATALDCAEKALKISAATGAPTTAHEDGTVDSLSADGRPAVSLQETSVGILELAERTGLGPLSLRRLLAALGRTDHSAVTAQQLAEFYGVMPRSARRMLGLLVTAGYAREAGVRGATGAGRPHVVYEVDLPALSRVIAPGLGDG